MGKDKESEETDDEWNEIDERYQSKDRAGYEKVRSANLRMMERK